MLFNSTDFLVFFGLFFFGYILVHSRLAVRNVLIVVGSYIFYSAWDPRFSILLFLSSVSDFAIGRGLDRFQSNRLRRALLVTSIVFNLGVLAAFKYFNFFRESFELLLNTFGMDAHWRGWDVALPVGISFYTFQTMSYVIDVYWRRLPACRDLVQFLGFVAFFPQLVAGPIERARHLLSQFARPLRVTIEDLDLGLWLILWGLFQKVVLADNLASMVDLVYGQAVVSGPVALLGTTAFALQIYCDFAGYSDIARGVARLLGFHLMINFNLPYFATNLREFWSRWHISLSTWLRDYLYIPLGGNQRGEARTCLNLAITFLLGGLWHGASVTFVLWGAWHALGLMAARWWTRRRPRPLTVPDSVSWLLTALFVLYGWMLFRAQSIEQVIGFTASLANWSLPSWWRIYTLNLLVLAAPLIALQVWQWRAGHIDAPLQWPRWRRGALQALFVLIIAAFWQQEAAPFVYFQF